MLNNFTKVKSMIKIMLLCYGAQTFLEPAEA